MLTQEELKRWIHYDPITGIFTWLKTHRRGYEAGNLDRYRVICIRKQRYTAAKLAWLYMTGEWSDQIIDHKDRNSHNDKWENLRKATNSQNQANKEVLNSTGFRGVKVEGRKFCAEIRIDGVKVYLGLYDTPEEAHAAYKAKAIELYGEFVV